MSIATRFAAAWRPAAASISRSSGCALVETQAPAAASRRVPPSVVSVSSASAIARGLFQAHPGIITRTGIWSYTFRLPRGGESGYLTPAGGLRDRPRAPHGRPQPTHSPPRRRALADRGFLRHQPRVEDRGGGRGRRIGRWQGTRPGRMRALRPLWRNRGERHRGDRGAQAPDRGRPDPRRIAGGDAARRG